MAAVPAQNSKRSTSGSLDPKRIPHIAVYSSPCCGLGDVTGIQSVTKYVHDAKIPPEYIFASLHAARARHYKEWDRHCETKQERERSYSAAFYSETIPKDMNEVRNAMNSAFNYAAAEYATWRQKNAPVGCYVFTITDKHDKRYSGVSMITKFIEDNKLGTTTTQKFYNPNSMNEVFIVTWAVEQNRWEELGREWLGKDYR